MYVLLQNFRKAEPVPYFLHEKLYIFFYYQNFINHADNFLSHDCL